MEHRMTQGVALSFDPYALCLSSNAIHFCLFPWGWLLWLSAWGCSALFSKVEIFSIQQQTMKPTHQHHYNIIF